MDPQQTSAMEKVARAATPGPWTTDYRFGEASMVVADGIGRMPLAATGLYPLAQNNTARVEANAAFIATFDPPTILRLLAERRAMVEALTETAGQLQRVLDMMGLHHDDVAETILYRGKDLLSALTSGSSQRVDEGGGSAQSQPCAETGTHIPSSPDALSPLEIELREALRSALAHLDICSASAKAHPNSLIERAIHAGNAALAKAEGRS